jgi:hypothetical protein
MAFKVKKGYQVQNLDNLSLQDFKNEGFKISLLQTKQVGAKLIGLNKGDESYMAITCKGFEGDVSLNTFVIFGNNAEGEKRMYLTNTQGAKVLTEDFL